MADHAAGKNFLAFRQVLFAHLRVLGLGGHFRQNPRAHETDPGFAAGLHGFGKGFPSLL